MRDDILGLLAPIRRRCRWQSAFRIVGLGIVLGASASGVLVLAHRWLGSSAGVQAGLAALLAGPIIGVVLGLARRPPWPSIAALVDDRCRLQDRSAAALEFSGKPSLSDFERLQVHDTLRHLRTIEAAAVVPLRPPAEWPVAALSLAVAIGLLAWPLGSIPARPASQDLFAPALAEARELEETARQIEAAAKELQCPELEAIARRMRHTIAELKQPGLDMRETMAKLSELQAFIAEFQKGSDTGPVDEELHALGEAMAGARPLAPAGKALENQQLEQAARALEQARSAVFDRREAQAVAPRLKQSAASMEARKLDALSRATARLAAGVNGDPESLKRGTQDLAKEIRERDRRKRIIELMASEQRRLADCKNRCEKQMRNLIAQRSQEEQQKTDGRDGRSGSGKKPDTHDAARDELNRPTENLEKIKGQPGEGPAAMQEDGHSPHGERIGARRPALKVHQKYKRMSEAVLDREPIPLGHRESIRRYFELIRPPAADSETPGPSKGPE